MRKTKRPAVRGLAALAVMAAVVTGLALWPSGQGKGGQQAAARARQYLNVTACLLTGSGGIAPGTPGAPVWRAMQAASLATHVMVSYLPDAGRATAATMLNSLASRQCGVIITTGTPAAEVIKAAKDYRHQSFMLVAAPGPVTAAGMTNAIFVSPANARERIGQVIHALAAQAH
jgi:hypothetical protein